MGKKTTAGFLVILAIGGILLGWLFYPNPYTYVLNPRGIVGQKESALFAWITGVMQLVVIPVFILAVAFARKYREGNEKAVYDPNLDEKALPEVIWWGVPVIIIAFFSYYAWTMSYELDPFHPIGGNVKPMTIQVVALRWKWLFLYPEQRVASVNVVHFPVNTPIRFELTADAPMNSFWIPQLGGQVYAMPRMRTELHLMADASGNFRGSSANLSGKGFAGMTFVAKATSDEEFSEWVDSVQKAPDVLDKSTYAELAEPSQYVPPKVYALKQERLFDMIIEKYLVPKNE